MKNSGMPMPSAICAGANCQKVMSVLKVVRQNMSAATTTSPNDII